MLQGLKNWMADYPDYIEVINLDENGTAKRDKVESHRVEGVVQQLKKSRRPNSYQPTQAYRTNIPEMSDMRLAIHLLANIGYLLGKYKISFWLIFLNSFCKLFAIVGTLSI